MGLQVIIVYKLEKMPQWIHKTHLQIPFSYFLNLTSSQAASMDVALASKGFPSPSNATMEQPISKRDKAVANDSSASKHTYLDPNANDVSYLLFIICILENIGKLVVLNNSLSETMSRGCWNDTLEK